MFRDGYASCTSRSPGLPEGCSAAGARTDGRRAVQGAGSPPEEIIECLVAGDAYRLESLDAPLSADGSGKPRLVADAVGSIDPQIDHITNREAVRALVTALPPRERQVLHMRFFEAMTQSQIAERIGVSQMQVSRILANTLRCLRDQLE